MTGHVCRDHGGRRRDPPLAAVLARAAEAVPAPAWRPVAPPDDRRPAARRRSAAGPARRRRRRDRPALRRASSATQLPAATHARGAGRAEHRRGRRAGGPRSRPAGRRGRCSSCRPTTGSPTRRRSAAPSPTRPRSRPGEPRRPRYPRDPGRPAPSPATATSSSTRGPRPARRRVASGFARRTVRREAGPGRRRALLAGDPPGVLERRDLRLATRRDPVGARAVRPRHLDGRVAGGRLGDRARRGLRRHPGDLDRLRGHGAGLGRRARPGPPARRRLERPRQLDGAPRGARRGRRRAASSSPARRPRPAPDDLVVERIDGRLVLGDGPRGILAATPVALLSGARPARDVVDALLDRVARQEA